MPTFDFEKTLADKLSRHLKGPDGETPPNLEESIRYSLLAPGKRIRPRLLMECSRMVSLPEQAAASAAAALEMIHCFTLIHDDLPCMDDDDFRRGLPSNHKKFGEAIALLAGDGLMALAVDAFCDASPFVKPECFLAGLRRLTWAMGPRAVIGGQAAEALMSPESSLEDLRKMHAQKTGALFSAALLIPKDLAGISDHSEQGHAIDHFARELGLGFQVADDFEDETGTPELTSVLHFQSKDQAKRETLSRMRAANDGLRLAWGGVADQLIAISNEVIKKLESL